MVIFASMDLLYKEDFQRFSECFYPSVSISHSIFIFFFGWMQILALISPVRNRLSNNSGEKNIFYGPTTVKTNKRKESDWYETETIYRVTMEILSPDRSFECDFFFVLRFKRYANSFTKLIGIFMVEPTKKFGQYYKLYALSLSLSFFLIFNSTIMYLLCQVLIFALMRCTRANFQGVEVF